MVAIAGSVTERSVGGSMSEIDMSVLDRGDDAEDQLSYLTRTSSGKLVKSSTVMLRDNTGSVFGALCVNLDVTVLGQLRTLVGELAGIGTTAEAPTTTYGDDIDAVVDATEDEHQLRLNKPWAALSRDERLDLFRSQHARGVFAVRRAVPRVAARIGISRASANNHLADIRKKEHRDPARHPRRHPRCRRPPCRCRPPLPGRALPHLDDLVGAEVLLKCENLQRIGAFKFRGAYNAASRLSPQQLAKGVGAYSSGNHAQAVALAARELGSRAVILIPEDTPKSKIDATRGYGAEIVTYDRYTGDRVALSEALAARRGLALIPPYDHPHVIVGQGTAALELLEDEGPVDTLVVPVGGGGLIAGSSTVAKALRPGIRVIGVEPAAGDDTKRSLAVGERVSIPVPRTIADGQAASIPGEMTFSINGVLVDDIALVSDNGVRQAMRFAFERLKLVLEHSGATGLAALIAGEVPASGRVGVIIRCGNISTERFAELIA